MFPTSNHQRLELVTVVVLFFIYGLQLFGNLLHSNTQYAHKEQDGVHPLSLSLTYTNIWVSVFTGCCPPEEGSLRIHCGITEYTFVQEKRSHIKTTKSHCVCERK